MQVKVERETSFVRFVYPFALSRECALGNLVEALRDSGWKDERFPEGDLLPHVRDYLNSSERDNDATAYLLTYCSEQLLQHYSGRLLVDNGASAQGIPFTIREAQLALFRGGIAMLTLEARVDSDCLADWLDFIYHFRFYKGQADDKQDVSAPRLEYEGRTEQGIHTLLEELLQSPLQLCNSRENLFMYNLMLPFSALYIDGDLSDDEKRRLLYRVRLCFTMRHDLHPPEAELRPDHPHLLEYAEQIWFTFAQQAAGFVAFNAPGNANDFFRGNLPQRLRNRYFLLYQLALYQKFRLIHLSNRVSQNWLSGDEGQRRRTFREIRDELLEFTARGYFAQVMHQEQHHRYYSRWCEVLQLERLYQEVSNEVREMYEYLQMNLEEQRRKQAEKLNRTVLWLTGVTIAFALPSCVVSGLGMNVQTIEAWDARYGSAWWIWVVALSVMVGALLSVLLVRVINYIVSRDSSDKEAV